MLRKASESLFRKMDKKALRKEGLFCRNSLENRALLDRKIFEKLIELEEFNSASLILTYVSFSSEVNTLSIIDYCLSIGKRVAVPRCTDTKGNMDFYLIDSRSSLTEGMFGVFEPDTEKCEILTDFSDSLMLVPGIYFTKKGHRLGYGKGYYDRFIKNYSFISVGLCYNRLIINELPTDTYDEKVDIIVTDKEIIRTDTEE